MTEQNKLPELRLLLAEDSEDDALLLIRLLRQSGYNLTWERVETAEAMRAALQNRVWDIVIADYSMPQFSGMDALVILQASGLDIPFILVSGAIGEERAVMAMKAGAHDYVMKNNLPRLLPAIERELREAEQRRARKQAEKQLFKLSAALAQSANLVTIMDMTGKIEYVNDSHLRFTGHTRDELVGQSGYDIMSGRITRQQVEQIAASIGAAGMWHGELPRPKADGSESWADVTISMIRDADGTPTHLISVEEDISERKRLEAELQQYMQGLERMVEERTEQLRQAKDQIEVILNSSSDAIILARHTGDILEVNPAFEKLMGDQVTQAIEQFLGLIVEQPQLEALARAFLSVMYDGHNQRIEVNVVRKDGKVMDADLALAPVMDSGAQKAGIVLSLRDITHLKDLERFKARFIANATHDLSNPISILKLQVSMLEMFPDRLAEYLQIFKNQVSRLEHLVTELRTLSEMDRSLLKLDLEAFDLRQVIESVVQVHQPIAQAKQQRLMFEAAPDLPLVLADRRKCERIVVNLITNGLSYTPPTGSIEVQLSGSANNLLFTVRDTGIGIEPDDLPHIFEPFYRGVRAKKHDSSGTGLGLAIVREMLEAQGGTITVKSQVNEGSTFIVALPAHSPAQTA